MTYINKFASLAAAFVALAFLSSCGDAKAGMPTPAGGSRSVPGYGEGTGSSGQTSAAKFLYANPLPGGGPYAQSIQSNGTLTTAAAGSANNINPRTMAIDPSGSFVFQTAEGYNGGTQGGLFVYQINRSSGSLGQATSSYLTGQAVYSDVVDNQGKFLYVQAAQGVYAFSIQSGTGALTQIAGSPFAASGPNSPGYSQPATLMAVDQMNHFLYVSTTSGIAGFTIDQNTGQLTPIAGSPFGTSVNGPWTIVVTPHNGFLYELESRNSSTLHGYSIDQNTGVLTALQGSPFSTGTCGSLVAPGTAGIPGPDNMTIATAGKFMYDNCGIYSLDPTTGTVAQVSSSGPGDWPVIDPTGNFLWAITSDQQSCFHCDIGVSTYQVDPNTGALTPVPNSFLLLTNSAVGSVNALAITK
jgi:6-phosphogluconolactonase (cycloisomerase 2 family)